MTLATLPIKSWKLERESHLVCVRDTLNKQSCLDRERESLPQKERVSLRETKTENKSSREKERAATNMIKLKFFY